MNDCITSLLGIKGLGLEVRLWITYLTNPLKSAKMGLQIDNKQVDIMGSRFMTNEQILKKAYDKARDNGWDVKAYLVATQFLIDRGLASHTYRIFIFSHDFAKAFWGEENVCSATGEEECFCQIPDIKWIPKWQYHLPRTVLKKEPLKYIEKFL